MPVKILNLNSEEMSFFSHIPVDNGDIVRLELYEDSSFLYGPMELQVTTCFPYKDAGTGSNYFVKGRIQTPVPEDIVKRFNS